MSKVIELFKDASNATNELLEYLKANVSEIEDIICIVSLKEHIAILHNGPSIATKCYMKEILANEIKDEIIYEE